MTKNEHRPTRYRNNPSQLVLKIGDNAIRDIQITLEDQMNTIATSMIKMTT